MPGLLRSTFIAGCCMAVFAAGWVAVAFQYDPQQLIDTRSAHFTRIVDSESVFEMRPEELRAAGFLIDSPESQAAFQVEAWQRVAYLRDLPADLLEKPTMARAKAIAFAMSAGGGCGEFEKTTRLFPRLHAMAEGLGWCSDHTEGFLALAPMWDIFAAEVATSVHNIVAIWVSEENRWVLLDPQSCLIPRDADGRYLSLTETRRRSLAGELVDWEFFGTPEKHFTCVTPAQLGNFDSRDDFRDATMTFGANVLENDAYRGTLNWLPKPLRQACLLASGIMPHYVMLKDGHAGKPAKLAAIWWRDIAYGSVMVLMLLAYPIAWVLRLISSLLAVNRQFDATKGRAYSLAGLHMPRPVGNAA